MSFTKLQQSIANIEIWKKDLKEDQTPADVPALFNWVKAQLLQNLAPLLEEQAKANLEELGEIFEVLEDQGNAIEDLVDDHGDLLQPEMASDLTATLLIGMFIVDTLRANKIQLSDELMNKKLQDAAKLFQQNSVILLEQIKEVTVEEDDEEEDLDDDTDDDGDEPETIIHGEGEDGGGGSGDGSIGSSGDGSSDGGGDVADIGTGDSGSGSTDRQTGSGGQGVLATDTGATESEGA